MVEINTHRKRRTSHERPRSKSRNSGVQLIKYRGASEQDAGNAQDKPKTSPYHYEPERNDHISSEHHNKEYRGPRDQHHSSSTTPHNRDPHQERPRSPSSRSHGEHHPHGPHEQEAMLIVHTKSAAVRRYKAHSCPHPSILPAPVTSSTHPTKDTDIEMEPIREMQQEECHADTPTPTATGAKQHQQPHSSSAFGDHHFVDNTEEQKQLTKLRNFVEHTIKSGLDGMEKSWKLMTDYLPPASTRIDFDENPEKNRFQDMICIDQSRVFLKGAGPDYIHASWMSIGDKDKKCIITQLPLLNTVVDFWDMCIQNQVQGILLILTQFEFEKFAARAFLPGQGDFIHFDNHMKVGCLKVVEVSKNWSLHLITVKQGDRQRYFHLHHYKDWQHGKKPGSLDEIWQIESTFRRYTSPHVYMSLSGGGRAGTYGAFQLTHQYLHGLSDSLNVAKCVKLARCHRMHAVQSAAQYQFIYVAILKHILAMKNIDKLMIDKEKFDKAQQIVNRFAMKDE